MLRRKKCREVVSGWFLVWRDDTVVFSLSLHVRKVMLNIKGLYPVSLLTGPT